MKAPITPITLGTLPTQPGRTLGCAWADYDNNGFQDLVVISRDGFPDVLYRNHGNGNHWIQFKLVGTRSNRSAFGATVRVRATIFGKTYWQLRELGGASRQQNDLRPHFGLGDAPRATTVRVEWPSGTVEEFSNPHHPVAMSIRWIAVEIGCWHAWDYWMMRLRCSVPVRTCPEPACCWPCRLWS